MKGKLSVGKNRLPAMTYYKADVLLLVMQAGKTVEEAVSVQCFVMLEQ